MRLEGASEWDENKQCEPYYIFINEANREKKVRHNVGLLEIVQSAAPQSGMLRKNPQPGCLQRRHSGNYRVFEQVHIASHSKSGIH